MNITIKIIPHETQRYDTVGDWYFDSEDNPTELYIMVSSMKNSIFEYLVALHEQIEAMQCLHDGVTEKSVSDFDIEYEKNRTEGDISEPGNSSDAPYYRQHKLATTIEMQAADALGIDWEAYDAAVNAL